MYTSFLSFGLALVGLTNAIETYERNIIFEPPTNANWTDPRVLYARTVQLEDGRLLATWENYSPEPNWPEDSVYYPVVESWDAGVTWEEVGQVHDQENQWGMRYQPFLYELRQDLGDFKAGTVLCAGNSIPTDLSETKIDVYTSTDKGRTWEFVSRVVRGGVALPNNEETPVWEPEILVYEDELILYFADQRDPETGQELSHKTTKDLKTWSETVTDVRYPEWFKRPGMPVVAKLPTGDYIYVFEYGGAPITPTYRFPIYYRIAKDPRKFADAPDFYINATNTEILPNNSPYVVWSPTGGPNGSIIVSSNLKYLYINRELGDPDAWVAYDTPAPEAYTRNLRIIEGHEDYLLITGAGILPPAASNVVECSLVRVSELLRKPVGGCKRKRR